jgi:RHS repeat-associated protein
MSNKSGTSSQVITLPSGGGALQGIGETFSPDLFTGTGNFTVPLALPSGRNGFQPQLALVYSTGHGNGPFGLGWDLSVPGVSRKTSKGIPLYRDHVADAKEQDTFVLSGAEDLVPVSEPAPDVTRFRPRTEGLFARIERVQTAGDDFWRVRSKDGLVSLYGVPITEEGDPAVVADPAARHKIFCWKLARTTDPFGNRIDYQYLRDGGSEGPHVWDQLYLQRVQYVDYEVDGQIRFLVSVTFIYEARPDQFSEYRAGFEIRTRLRCRRIAIRTHADQDRLARTYELVYLDDRVRAGELPPVSLPLNGASLLSQVQVVGHDGDLTEKLPPLEFGYTRFAPEEHRFQPIKAVNNALPPRSLADGDFEMVGLFGNGLPDIVQMNGAVQFWRNLGNGLFDIPRTMSEVPAGVHLRDPGVQFADMNGDGRADLLVLSRQGYFPLSFQGRWSPQGFVQYAKAPSVNFGDNNTRLVDLDGDGVIDALRTGVSIELFFNDPQKGWETVETRPRRPIEEFPDVSFSDPRVKLADLTGDNLQDFVLVEQGRIDYWPYLGHGQWGRRVTMNNSPIFRDVIPVPGGFDPKRVLLGDLDGDGLDDILYIEPNRLTFWINQGGERWSDPIPITNTPPLTDVDAVRLADMLGTGMAGVLWTFDETAGGNNFQFLDLTGGLKPYLLEQMNNHMGAVTRVQYALSTKFYLADVGKPETRWKTPLPFPIQVVERVEVIDEISRGKLTTTYRYHHGCWDGAEREFRGFGRVEQLDTEGFEEFNGPGLHGTGTPFERVVARRFSPPLLTRTWFHLGAIGDEFRERQEADFSGEYFPEDPSVLERPQQTIALLQGLAGRPRADALRSLRGSILRTELYALDGSEREDRPFTVTESQYGIREESPPAGSDGERRRIFFPHPIAQRTTQWERGDEPMTQFAFTDDYDAYGQPSRQVTLAVPRHRDYRAPATAGVPYLGTLTETQRAQRDDAERYIVDRVSGSTSSEILNDGSPTVFDLYFQIQAAIAARQPVGPTFGQTFNYYDGEAFVGSAFGKLGDFGALARTASLILTEDILREAFRDPPNPNALVIPPYLRPEGVTTWPADYPKEFQDQMPAMAGYIFADGSDHRARGYFAHGSRVAFDFQEPRSPRRGLPVTVRDPLGNDSTIIYDRPYHLLPVQVTDAVGLTTSAEHDYRVLQPRMVTDANGNRRAMTFSPLGFATGTAVMGKEREKAGDTLETPGSHFEYDFFAFVSRKEPVFVRSTIREYHVTETDVSLPERDQTIESVEYSDGFGRLLQTRTQAEDVLFGDSNFGGGVLSPDQSVASDNAVGRRRAAGAPPNVIVSGAQVYDNKGRAFEKYEPFFAVGMDYVPPSDAQFGQKATMFYDPRGQVIRTLNPDGSEQRVIYGVPANLTDPDNFVPTPWEVYTYDGNDLALLSQTPEGKSLARAAPATHHFTPSHIVIDALGRTIEAITRNGSDPVDWFHTRSTYDIRGNVLTVTDALNRVAFHYTCDLANRPWRIESIDAGLRRMVLNVLGNETERRDSKGALILQAYDRLNRPIRLWTRDDTDSPITLRQRMEYGDAGRPDQAALERAAMRAKNLLGQLIRHHDEAGLTTIAAVDYKGNVLDKSRRVIADVPILAVFDQAPAKGWQVTPFQVDWDPRPQHTLADREGELLETTVYQTTSSVDALNRIQRLQLPQDVEGKRRELRPTYNNAGGLEQVFLNDTLYVERLAYDAKGQRTLIAYGNGVMSRYAYDPHTFRLKHLRSERYSKPNDVTYHPRGEVVQDLGYDYDLVGNIVAIHDRTPGSGIVNNSEALTVGDPVLAQLLVSGNALNRHFGYDPIYRLLSATGRECDPPPEGDPWEDQPRCTDFTRATGYTERYRYDANGNMLQLQHRNEPGGFTREFTVETANNQLRRMQIGDADYGYTFDANGNMRSETTSRHFEWNHSDQMKAFRTQTKGVEPSVHAHYLYDATGQRVKKLVRKQGGQVEITHYIDGVFEHHRWGGQSQAGENNHVHVMDDTQRVALLRLGEVHPDDRGPAVQFHICDHLGSSNVVVDSSGVPVNREEFTPYGETSFGSFSQKRYRFTGMERDEESGLTHQGARYYACGLARWCSCDPVGIAGGINLLGYASCSPMRFVDHSGMQPTTADSGGNYEAPAETIEVTGTAPPDVVGSAVKRGIINPLPTREQIASNLIAQDKRYDVLAAQRYQILSESDPEAAQAELGERVEQAYESIVAKAEADLDKTHRMASSAMPFVGIALGGSAVASLTAWAEPCLVTIGIGETTVSTAGSAAAGRFAAYAGAATFYNWASGRDRNIASPAAGTTKYDGHTWKEIAGYRVQMKAERVGLVYEVTISGWFGKRDPVTGKELKGKGIKPFVDALRAEAQASGASILEVTGTLIANDVLTNFDARHARVMGFSDFQRVAPTEFTMRTYVSSGRATNVNVMPSPNRPIRLK